MIWCGKLTVLWAAVFYGFCYLFLFATDPAGFFYVPFLTSSFLRLILPVWLLFRLIDFLIGGPAARWRRRRAERAVYGDPLDNWTWEAMQTTRTPSMRPSDPNRRY